MIVMAARVLCLPGWRCSGVPRRWVGWWRVPGALVVVRAVMGVGAALIFPATLAVISNLYTERGERARAIGLWGAMTGLGVALGPITGGWLLEHFWWGSVFVVMAPVAAVTLLGAVLFVPTSRDPATPPLDVGGLVLSTVAIGTLVFTIIEAPERGWTAPATVVGFALTAAASAVFVAWERRRVHPMLDVSLFRNLRFSAASGSIMVIFFALAGFVFLITQYFQFLKGYAPFSTGLRILPVAICIAGGSVVGVRLSVSVGNKAVVASGLALVGVSFAWVSTASTATPYIEIVGQMVLAGVGMGLTTAPATEAIMGVVPKEKAGIGSAVNDATRELGATLGVAIIGSVYASLYASGIDDAAGTLPAPALDAASDSIGAALTVAAQLGPAGQPLLEASQAAFFDGFALGCLVAASVLIVGAAFAARFFPSRPTPSPPHPNPTPVPAPALETASTAVAAGLPGCCWDREPSHHSSTPSTETLRIRPPCPATTTMNHADPTAPVGHSSGRSRARPSSGLPRHTPGLTKSQ